MADKKNEGSDAASAAGEGNAAVPEEKAAKTTRARKAKSDDGIESATRKAKSAAKKVAAAVTETVRDIADKVAGKKAPAARKTASKKSDAPGETVTSSAVPVKKTSRKAASGENAGSDATEKPARRASSRTVAGALAEGTTSQDVHEALLGLANSEDVPAESNPEVDAATDVREHFFEVHGGPPPPQPPRDLPDEYGDTKIVLLVRDPEWIYAYWEVNDDTRSQINFPRNGASQHRVVLRIYKITDTAWPVDPAHYFFDVEVPSEARNWYIHLPEADQQWCAELGLMDSAENYVMVCRSNAIVTPRNTISERLDSDWMTVEESFEKITRLSRAGIEAQLQGVGAAGSEAILRTINRQLTAVLHGEKMALSSGIFSSEALAPARHKDFWLQVHTELILYGATEPDAKVTVQGQDIKLNADGTFSLRFALPDGMQILNVHATNADGDMEEEITPVVGRTTR